MLTKLFAKKQTTLTIVVLVEALSMFPHFITTVYHNNPINVECIYMPESNVSAVQMKEEDMFKFIKELKSQGYDLETNNKLIHTLVKTEAK